MFIVEGNIGSGKSTLLKTLSKIYKVNTEPIDKWLNVTDSNKKSIFEYFNEDPKRHSLCLQLNIFQTRLEDFMNSDARVFERSLLSDVNIFVKTLLNTKQLSEIEYTTFTNLFSLFTKFIDLSKIEGIIYLKVDPITCYERINKRNRVSENNISLDYLTQLHEGHELWLNNETNYKVLIIDDNDNKNVQKIVDFIDNI